MDVNIRGEYWIEDGSTEFADGDIGDNNHESLATRHILSKYSDEIIKLAEELEMDTESIDIEGYDGVDPDALAYLLSEISEILILNNNVKNPDKYIMDELNCNQEALDVLKGRGNPSLYVMKYENWIAVRGMNIELYGYNEQKRKSLERGLSEILWEEGVTEETPAEEIEFSLYDNKTQRETYLSLADIERPIGFTSQIKINTKGHSKFFQPTKDQTENIPFQNKSVPNPINTNMQKLGAIGPGQQLWRGTSETNMNFKEWFESASNQLDTNQNIQSIINQYLSAFGRFLDNGATDEKAMQSIETTEKQIAFRWGKDAGEFFKNKALAKLKNLRSYQSAKRG